MIEHGSVPKEYIKFDGLGREVDHAAKSGNVITINASTADFAIVEAAAKAKKNTITYSICAEMGLSKKVEKPPEHMYEAMPNRPKSDWLQYNPVKFDAKVAG